MTAKPTQQQYEVLQRAYDLFNKKLFDGQLPDCLITLQRKNGAAGYWSKGRFKALHHDKLYVDEIALNPDLFHKGDKETMQTLVHEMAHLWQDRFGTPSRRTYHNKEWADKMESMGLMPSSTGRPGGKRTGQSMGDYAIDGGRFLRVYEQWAQECRVEWGDALGWFGSLHNQLMQQLDEAAGVPAAVAEAAARKTQVSKQKFTCGRCGLNAWAKPSAKLVCGECGVEMGKKNEAEN